ncbi:MAG TPA: YbaK/EbsC family protein [Anaerolineae bacterium]|nr:YbaK/EbsC family protein [Anaerolineae bacterium]
MTKIRTHAIRALDEMGIAYQVLTQAHKARNVEEAAAERGVSVDEIVKTLLVRRPDRRHVIVLVRGDQRLSLKKLARLVGVKSLEMAPEPDVPRITGYQIGAVAPLGLRRSDLPIFVDHHILERSRVSISAGRHDTGLELATEDLIRAVGGQMADITE